MTPPSTTTTTVDLRSPGDLLAATPQLLGFRPTDSVLVIGHRAPAGTRIGAVLRADLPPPGEETTLARRLRNPLAHDSVAVTVVVVGPDPRDPDDSGPVDPGDGDPGSGNPDEAAPCGAGTSPGVPEQRGWYPSAPGYAAHILVDALTAAFDEVGVPVTHALWTVGIRAGAPWRCFDDDCCAGRLPDPRSSVLAAVTTHAGLVTYRNRGDMGGQLEPVAAETLARRSALLDARGREEGRGHGNGEDGNRAVDHGRSVVRAALARAWTADPDLSDGDVVELASALAVPSVRDACLATALPSGGARAAAAERLWLALSRNTPAPHRARPLTLLAYSAYVRGEGAFAGMALSRAVEADPEHVLAQLLSRALDHALPPDTLARLATAVDDEPLCPDEPLYPDRPDPPDDDGGDGSRSSSRPGGPG